MIRLKKLAQIKDRITNSILHKPEDINRTLLKEQIKNMPQDILYKLNENGERTKIIYNSSVKNKFKEEIFAILNSCPNSVPKQVSVEANSEINRRLNSLGYIH